MDVLNDNRKKLNKLIPEDNMTVIVNGRWECAVNSKWSEFSRDANSPRMSSVISVLVADAAQKKQHVGQLSRDIDCDIGAESYTLYLKEHNDDSNWQTCTNAVSIELKAIEKADA